VVELYRARVNSEYIRHNLCCNPQALTTRSRVCLKNLIPRHPKGNRFRRLRKSLTIAGVVEAIHHEGVISEAGCG